MHCTAHSRRLREHLTRALASFQKGADAHLVAKKGLTPADVAECNAHHDIQELLLSWNPRPASTATTQSTSLSRVVDGRGLADAGTELPCQGTTTAQNAAVEVIQIAESAPAAEVTQ